jgi:hypothetical protein
MRLRALVEGPGIDIVGEGPTPEDERPARDEDVT